MLKRFLGVMSPFYTLLDRFVSGARKIGTDPYGNTYYTAKPRPGYKQERRLVMYKARPEATLVPPEWHAWLHHQSDVFPSKDQLSFRRPWQLPHQPNMTGTTKAYRPPGHVLEGGERPKTTGDYEAWTPDQKMTSIEDLKG